MPKRLENPTEKQLMRRARNERARAKVQKGLKSDDPATKAHAESRLRAKQESRHAYRDKKTAQRNSDDPEMKAAAAAHSAKIKTQNDAYKAKVKADPVKLAHYVEQYGKRSAAAAQRREDDPVLRAKYNAYNEAYAQREKALREERVCAYHRAFLAKNPSLEFSIDITFEPRKFGLECVEDVVEHYAAKGEFPLIYHVTKQDPREFDLVDGQHQIEPRHAQNDEKNRYVWAQNSFVEAHKFVNHHHRYPKGTPLYTCVILPTHSAYLTFRPHYWGSKPSRGCEFFVKSPKAILFEPNTPGTICIYENHILWSNQ